MSNCLQPSGSSVDRSYVGRSFLVNGISSSTNKSIIRGFSATLSLIRLISSWNVVACLCNLAGTAGGDVACDQATGQCNCKPNIFSLNCSRCRDGFYDFPAYQLSPEVRLANIHITWTHSLLFSAHRVNEIFSMSCGGIAGLARPSVRPSVCSVRVPNSKKTV